MPDLLTVDLWLAQEPANLSRELAASYAALLSEEEHQRLQRFLRAEDRQRFLVARALTRTVLAGYLESTPAALEFTQGHYGKPILAHGREAELHFNLSHTRGMAVLGVCRKAELGVDVEALTRKVELMDLARRYFSASEIQSLEALQGQEQRELFFALWTLKEAWVKAKGLGLRLPLDAFGFSLTGAGLQNDQITLHCDASLQEAPLLWSFQRYQLQDFRIGLAVKNNADASVLVKVLQTDEGFRPMVSNC